MKATGIVRKIDESGRVVIPKEVRKVFELRDHDPVEIFTNESGEIILKPFRTGCVFCDQFDQDKLVKFKGKLLCKQCASGISNFASL